MDARCARGGSVLKVYSSCIRHGYAIFNIYLAGFQQIASYTCHTLPAGASLRAPFPISRSQQRPSGGRVRKAHSPLPAIIFQNLKSGDTLKSRDPSWNSALHDRVANNDCRNLRARDLVLLEAGPGRLPLQNEHRGFVTRGHPPGTGRVELLYAPRAARRCPRAATS